MRNVVYFDLETQRTANDVGGWHRKGDMGMSIGVTYSTLKQEYKIYREANVHDLVQELLHADLVVGFNVLHFDYEVLMGYTALDLPGQLRTLDMLLEIEKIIGHRVKLDSLAQASLGLGKTAEGLDAIRWWRQGKLREIAEYCCFDVKVTKLVHEHGIQKGELFFMDRFGRKQSISLDWKHTSPVYNLQSMQPEALKAA